MNGITLFSLLITLSVYLFSRVMAKRFPSPLTTPVFFSTAIIIIILLMGDITYEEYTPAKDLMTYLLGPATVALAVPLYHNREVLLSKLMPASLGLIIGTVSTIVSAVWLVKLFGLSKVIAASAGTKSVTTPVAIEAAKIIGGDPALSAAFVMVAGMFGAMLGPALLTLLKVTDPFSRGLAIGTVAHGIGTSQAAMEGPLQGAVSGAAMGFAAIITSFILPWLFPLLF
ncbi:putative murein hydrolase (TIGR00659 family) [Bacillus ectoiniformans]|uniref:LrgB family protein n=1 Tax=Bacillus ectoiniformans TaxID=1494429 RepID=UPI00195923FD|nr:LrgB family protein [Bacillus ectoiniformans]MBM7647707.1 putative murein hydrolase (TIGR00659 family) [Bacillus ectoiniformans]